MDATPGIRLGAVGLLLAALLCFSATAFHAEARSVSRSRGGYHHSYGTSHRTGGGNLGVDLLIGGLVLAGVLGYAAVKRGGGS